MSNTIAGDIFQSIIQNVISASSTDFEENGVTQQTLTELQQTWQAKLSARNVAQMPWDPKPQPPPQATTTPSSSTPHHAPGMTAYAGNAQAPSNGTPRVKAEPGTESGMPGYVPHTQPVMNPVVAQQRAAMHMQQQFGSQANASLGAMQRGGIALPGQPRPQGLQLPPQSAQQNQQAYQQQQQQYAEQMRRQQAAQQPRIKQENVSPQLNQGGFQQQQQNGANGSNLGYSQTDGAGDAMEEWQQYMAAKRALTSEQLIANDCTMRDHVAELAASLDNGLMMPLDQRKKASSRKRRPIHRAVAGPSASSSIPQLDGDVDEDEKPGVKDEDEDAINSDLDSSADEAANAEEEDEEIDSMLCTYDKVQRVKNKWKCTLKDGILLANGKEYVFHKAQGEFEW